MAATVTPTQYLLTLPPRRAEAFARLEQRSRPEWFAACDPPGQSLGSGGGTANLPAKGAPGEAVKQIQ